LGKIDLHNSFSVTIPLIHTAKWRFVDNCKEGKGGGLQTQSIVHVYIKNVRLFITPYALKERGREVGGGKNKGLLRDKKG